MAKTPHQIIRESVRRVLREAAPAAKKPAAPPPAAPGDKLKLAVFGDVKGGATTSFYDEVLEAWANREEGKYVFVFTPSADKKTLSVTVTAEGGADESPVEGFRKKLVDGDPENSVPSIISKLTPDMWADIGTAYTYSLPGGVAFSGEMDLTKESRMLSERWMKIAGLLTEAPADAIKLVKAYDAKRFKSESEMQAAKKELAMGLKGLKITTVPGITEVIEAASDREEGQTFAEELAAMQK